MNTNDSNNNKEIYPFIIDTMCMRMSEKEALDFLEQKGFQISSRTYYRLKEEIKESTHQRLNLIASSEFMSQHLDRIQTLQTINHEMWDNYAMCKDPFKRVQILEKIEENQDYLSSYYDSTRWVLEQGVKMKQKQKEVSKGS
jgi:hypothetical protein